jgi:hypothetical protein
VFKVTLLLNAPKWEFGPRALPLTTGHRVMPDCRWGACVILVGAKAVFLICEEVIIMMAFTS